jgi:cytochrome b561
MKRTLAVADLMLVSPAIVFFLALFFRNFLPAGDPANGAQSLVMWYASRHWTLWVLLVALPLSALLMGSTALREIWTRDSSLRADAKQVGIALRVHSVALVTALATLSAAAVLFLVALHVAAN